MEAGSIAGSTAVGLSMAEAEQRLARDGPNEVAAHARASVLRQLVASLSNPLLGILLVAAGASAFLGERVNASIIVAMVVLSATIDFVQSYRSARAVERLRAQVAPTATVLRDGRWVELPRRELVRGDSIHLSAGDLVPADARLLSANALHAVESALTGESLPVEKEIGARADTGPVSPAWVYAGTSIASGTGEAVVEHTGARTQLGTIAARLAERPPDTAFERGLRDFGLFITRTILFLVLFIGVVSVALHRPPLESLLFAVALAVGLTPEFLPMITTVTLAEGAVRMARVKVIVKHLPAIQNLGSIDVLCSDKTGTLTRARMTLERSVDGAGTPAPAALRLARVNSALQTGLKNPLDEALLAGVEADPDGWRRCDEVPFDFERRRMSVAAERSGRMVLVCKGAPESVLSACTQWITPEGMRPLDDPARVRCQDTERALAGQGFRVLAVASRALGPDEPCGLDSERDLCLAGYLTFRDPPLEDAAATVIALRRDGVAVKILSGDDPLVVRHVCNAVGIDGSDVVLGDDLDRLTDPALGQVAETSSVFARVSPQQKTRILLALRRRGHVVGFLGDGINDAPSLHTADVGISVASAVDVAREAADIVLLDRSLNVLHAGIVEGRKSFGNVMKYLLMGTSSNFGNMLSMAAASVFLPFLPMLPTQILLNNFLYDVAQVTIPTDRVDPSYLARPQRWDIRAVRRFMLLVGPVSSLYDFLTFWILLAVLHASERLFHTGWFIESLATQVLVVFVIRTSGNPFRSRPSPLLAVTAVAVVAVAAVLPWTALARPLGFEPLPGPFFLFLVVATATYLLGVQWVKARVLPRFTPPSPEPVRGGTMSPPPVAATLSQLETLLSEVERATPSTAELEPVARTHRAGAVNLRHYLALRSHDLRHLQQALAELGLSSLGRAEGHVEATLRAVRHALRGLGGLPPVDEHLRGPDFGEARGALSRNAEALLGPAPAGRAVRIMVTADAALADDADAVRALVDRGMSILRINCAHDGPEVWTRIAGHLRAAERATGRPCRILMDLGGPKIRTGPLQTGPAVVSWKLRRDLRGKLLAPTTVWIAPVGASPRAFGPVLHFPPGWVRTLQPGALLQFRDARGLRRSLRVVERRGELLRAEAERKAFVLPDTRFQTSGADPGACPVSLPEPELPITLSEGDRLVLTASLEPGRAEVRDASGRLVEPGRVGCTERALFARVRPGHRVLLDDGKFQAEALEVGPDRLELRIVRGPRPSGKLASEKGINVPDTELRLPALTDDDRRDLATVVQLADLVGMSFVQRPEDIRALRAELDRIGASHLGLILKIETTHAFASMPALLLAAMEHDCTGVMIARGDLAVECGYQRLAEVQEELLWICEAAHVPAIWATQVLEGLAKNGVPSRAEVTDAAMGERAECVMLNKGPHILDAVSALDDILRRMEEHQSKKTAQLRALRSWIGAGPRR